MLNSDVSARALLAFHHKQTGRLDVTSHEVMASSTEGQYTLGAGRAFSIEDKETLIDLLLNVDTDIEFIDTRILVKSRRMLVWYNPPQRVDVLFKGVSYEAPIPGLVYVASGGVLRCYAYKGKSRPTPDTKLFYAPLGNMYQSGSFCTGNCDVPKDNSISSIPGWERFVLQCVNTHTGGIAVLSTLAKAPASSNKYQLLMDFYKNLSDSGAKSFPATELMPVNGKRNQHTLKMAFAKVGAE